MTKTEDRKREHAEEVRVVLAECDLTPREAERFLARAHTLGRQLHALYEGACSVDLGETGNANRDSRIRSLEGQLRDHFRAAGLGLYLNSDPRGNPVGILTPRSGRYNTMGGREAGWRL